MRISECSEGIRVYMIFRHPAARNKGGPGRGGISFLRIKGHADKTRHMKAQARIKEIQK